MLMRNTIIWWRNSCKINIIIGYSWTINKPPLINASHIVHDGGTMASTHGLFVENFCQLIRRLIRVLLPFCHKLSLTWTCTIIINERVAGFKGSNWFSNTRTSCAMHEWLLEEHLALTVMNNNNCHFWLNRRISRFMQIAVKFRSTKGRWND